MTRERIEDMREVVLPFVKKRLLETNYEGLGESDAEMFAKDFNEILDMAIKALELEPCGVCIDFKRYAKQMGFEIEKESIPYLMHKEMDIPISECQKAYDVAIEYLRSQGKLKG